MFLYIAKRANAPKALGWSGERVSETLTWQGGDRARSRDSMASKFNCPECGTDLSSCRKDPLVESTQKYCHNCDLRFDPEEASD